ncbi:MAG: LuxR family transcriptional regulator [Xanthobacteraceae bacterium]|nr:MAG: LuxR family transcriptional regulator [Xanthobacteraceae bacterium]
MDRAAYSFSYIEKLDRAETVEVVGELLSTAGKNFGLEHVIVAGFPATKKQLDPYVLLHSWPKGWYDRYISRNYLQVDPVIRELRSTTMPVAWHEVPYCPKNDKCAHAVMMESREFRLQGGLSVPIYTQSGDQAGVSFGGSRYELGAEDRAALHLIAIYGHARALALKQTKQNASQADGRKAPRLTAREVEVLKWVAAGKTSDVISDILLISSTTVEAHVIHACRKLDVVNRTQAVAEAIRAKLIA